MPLNARQQMAYLDFVDIWKSLDITTPAADGFGQESGHVLLLENVQCKYFSRTEEAPINSLGGRIAKNLRLPQEECFRFSADIDILDGWFIHYKTIAHIRYGSWYVALGNAASRINANDVRAPNFSQVLVKRTYKELPDSKLVLASVGSPLYQGPQPFSVGGIGK